MIVKRFCTFCGKEFDCTNQYDKYCSDFCKEQSEEQFNELETMENYVYTKHCKLCGAEFYTGDKKAVFCSPECEYTVKNTKDMKGEVLQEYISVLQRGKEKIDREDFIKLFNDRHCAYCGCKLYSGSASIKSNLTVDHVIPVSKGGRNKNNLVLACLSCNISKGAKSKEEFLEYLKKNPEIVEQRRKDADENYNKIEKQKMIFDLVNRTIDKNDKSEDLF